MEGHDLDSGSLLKIQYTRNLVFFLMFCSLLSLILGSTVLVSQSLGFLFFFLHFFFQTFTALLLQYPCSLQIYFFFRAVFSIISTSSSSSSSLCWCSKGVSFPHPFGFPSFSHHFLLLLLPLIYPVHVPQTSASYCFICLGFLSFLSPYSSLCFYSPPLLLLLQIFFPLFQLLRLALYVFLKACLPFYLSFLHLSLSFSAYLS